MGLAVMRETLRMTPSATGRTIAALEDTVIGGGKYFIPKGVPMIVQVLEMQHDTKIWGEDVSNLIFCARVLVLIVLV